MKTKHALIFILITFVTLSFLPNSFAQVDSPEYVVRAIYFLPNDRRMIRGWQVSRHLTQPLTLKPLEQALRHSVPEIHHSDQGVQYISNTYISTLTDHGIKISVARRGCPWENGYAERLIRTLKEEEVHLNDYENITEARNRIGHFIEQVYHQKRPHSALGYLTPAEFERKNLD